MRLQKTGYCAGQKHDVVNISHMVSAILKLSRLEADVVEFNEKKQSFLT